MHLTLYCAIGAIIVSAVVLQIISLAKIAGLKKILVSLSEIRTHAHIPHEHHDRKPGEFRRSEKRNFPEQRVRQEKPPAEAGIVLPTADPVEKSLRDINMKLKHAERDQESARKRMHDPLSRGDHHRGGRNDRDRRGNRDRDRDGQRGNRRDNWQDRSRGGGQQRQEGNEVDETELPREPITAAIAPGEIVPPAQEPVAATQTSRAEDFASEESLQHGRKIVVRRRQLNVDAPELGVGERADQESAREIGS